MNIEILDCGARIVFADPCYMDVIRNPYCEFFEDFAGMKERGEIEKRAITVNGIIVGSYWGRKGLPA